MHLGMLKGMVIHRRGVGKKFGFPTANLELDSDELNLKKGVYAGVCFLNNKKYKSAVVILGTGHDVEAHLIDYKGDDFYGEILEVEIGEKVGEIEKFEDEEDLVYKIKRDLEKICQNDTSQNPNINSNLNMK